MPQSSKFEAGGRAPPSGAKQQYQSHGLSPALNTRLPSTEGPLLKLNRGRDLEWLLLRHSRVNFLLVVHTLRHLLQLFYEPLNPQNLLKNMHTLHTHTLSILLCMQHPHTQSHTNTEDVGKQNKNSNNALELSPLTTRSKNLLSWNLHLLPCVPAKPHPFLCDLFSLMIYYITVTIKYLNVNVIICGANNSGFQCVCVCEYVLHESM